jgi:hypothetical protein
MTDHHDWADHHDGPDHDAGDAAFHDDLPHYDDPQPYEHDVYDPHEPGDDTPDPGLHHHVDTDDHTPEPAADPGHADDIHTPDTPADLPHVTEPELVDTDTPFPPTVDVDLPEPVDGFPWIDTGSLGVIDPATIDATVHTDPVDPHDLAAYAGTELPPGADPWATLAESDDPATAALARWWAENQ